MVNRSFSWFAVVIQWCVHLGPLSLSKSRALDQCFFFACFLSSYWIASSGASFKRTYSPITHRQLVFAYSLCSRTYGTRSYAYTDLLVFSLVLFFSSFIVLLTYGLLTYTHQRLSACRLFSFRRHTTTPTPACLFCVYHSFASLPLPRSVPFHPFLPL